VIITLVVDSAGSVKNFALKEISGDASIYNAVTEAVNKASPFPAFPPQLKQQEIKVDIPLIFSNSLQG
jgi:TonB family protein